MEQYAKTFSNGFQRGNKQRGNNKRSRIVNEGSLTIDAHIPQPGNTEEDGGSASIEVTINEDSIKPGVMKKVTS